MQLFRYNRMTISFRYYVKKFLKDEKNDGKAPLIREISFPQN